MTAIEPIKSGMRQIFLEIGLQSWLKASFVVLVLLSFSRASKYITFYHNNDNDQVLSHTSF